MAEMAKTKAIAIPVPEPRDTSFIDWLQARLERWKEVRIERRWAKYRRAEADTSKSTDQRSDRVESMAISSSQIGETFLMAHYFMFGGKRDCRD